MGTEAGALARADAALLAEAAWEGKIDLIRRTVAQGASNDELNLFYYAAKRAGLDPLLKQIYYIKRKGKGTIQVAIDGLRLIADRTQRYAGADEADFLGKTEEGYPAIARVTVYKMVGGTRCPFSASARWEEYYPGDDQGFQWRKMPHTMLAKCAEALALRRAFPADMSGLYAMEEMAQAGQPAAEPPVDGKALWRWFASVGGTAEGKAEIIAKAKAEDTTGVALLIDAQAAGCVTAAQVDDYALRGVVPSTEEPSDDEYDPFADNDELTVPSHAMKEADHS